MIKSRNWKELNLKNAKLIPKFAPKIADVGAKLPNLGSTSLVGRSQGDCGSPHTAVN